MKEAVNKWREKMKLEACSTFSVLYYLSVTPAKIPNYSAFEDHDFIPNKNLNMNEKRKTNLHYYV